jgi:hypothetical protein
MHPILLLHAKEDCGLKGILWAVKNTFLTIFYALSCSFADKIELSNETTTNWQTRFCDAA